MKKLILTAASVLSVCFITSAQYTVSTYAGNGTAGSTNGNISGAKFSSPNSICMDKSGNIYISDGANNRIRMITPGGTVSTYAGSGTNGFLDGPKATAQFSGSFGVCTDDSGNVYVSDFTNQRIRKITALTGMVSTIAGTGVAGYNDGPANVAQFNYPRGICIDKQGNIYVGDSWNHRVRKIDPAGNVTTYAGGGSTMGVQSIGSWVDGNDISARFATPCGLAIDKFGNVYVADAYNHRIRKINTSRVVTTVCGIGTTPGVNTGGFADGPATSAQLSVPTEVFSDSLGNLLIGDLYNNRVRKADLTGNVTTVAGTGTAGFTNGAGTGATFNYPRGVTANLAGDSIYVVDFNNHAIRLIIGATNAIEELSSTANNIETYPSPALNHVTVLLKDSEDKDFKVFDIEGKNVTNNVLTESTTKENDQTLINLNLKKLASGIYIIRFNKSGFSGRIIKK